MPVLACPGPYRPQSLSAHSTLPCRHAVNRTALSDHPQPRPGRLFSLAIFASLSVLCLYVLAGAALRAQTAHVGKIVTLGSGFANPFTVAVEASGNVVVIDYGNHAVKEISASSGYTTVRTLVGGRSFIFGSAVDSHGNVFFTEYGKNHVEEILAVNGVIPPAPKVVILGSGFNIPAGVAVDQYGNVFIGDQNNNVVKEILASSGYATTITVATGFSVPDGVAVDQYGDVFVADDGNNAVKEIVAVNGVIPASPTIRTLGSGFLQPFDVAVDGGGNVYVADRGNNAVKEIMAVNGVIPNSPVINTLGSGFSTPTGVTVDSGGNVYVADNGNSAVKEIRYAGASFGQVSAGTTANAIPVTFTFDTGGTLGSASVITMGNTSMDFQDAGGGTCTANTVYSAGQTCTVNVKFAPTFPGQRNGSVELLNTTGTAFASGPLQGVGIGPQATFATLASGVLQPSSWSNLGSGFNSPGGVAVDANGNIFVSDSFNGAVKEILASGGWTTVHQLGGSFGFDYPNGVALDGGGNVYVADTLNDAVEEIVASGGYTTVITLGSGFSSPYAVAVDGSGNVFVADYSNGAVKEMMAVGGTIPASPYIRTLASGLNGPDGVAVDSKGNVFVAVYEDGTVLEIKAVNGAIPASPVTQIISSGFSGPSNLSVDAAGNVFVSDTDDGTVVEIVAAGGYSTKMVLGGSFSAPEATAVWGNGDVIVADAGSSVVQILDYADQPELTFATTPAGLTSSDSPQTVEVSNDGNTSLVFPLPSTGSNPSIPANFAWDNSSTCVKTTPASAQAFALTAGTSCTMAFDFKPVTTGAISGFSTLTDNNLNLSGSTQSVQLIGTGTAPAALTSPGANSVLVGPNVTFSWSAATGATGYAFRLGTTVGTGNVYASGALTSATTSVTPANLPTNGETLYGRLTTFYGARQLFTDYTFTAATQAAMISPAANSVFSGASVKFTWSAGTGATNYALRLGTTVGGNDIYASGPIAATTVTRNNLPTNGETIHARLTTFYGTIQVFTDYVYTAAP
jgi:large repetitive protein